MKLFNTSNIIIVRLRDMAKKEHGDGFTSLWSSPAGSHVSIVIVVSGLTVCCKNWNCQALFHWNLWAHIWMLALKYSLHFELWKLFHGQTSNSVVPSWTLKLMRTQFNMTNYRDYWPLRLLSGQLALLQTLNFVSRQSLSCSTSNQSFFSLFFPSFLPLSLSLSLSLSLDM